MMIQVHGKEGISATVIADSISSQGIRLTTFELMYPRFLHSEIMTHRMLSKNAASSRAVPYKTNVELIEQNPAMPVHWGKNQAGMKAKEELSDLSISGMRGVWLSARDSMINHTHTMNDAGLHKQVINRLLEPWTMMKTVITGTEWENFFWLRDHEDAQPEFQELAKTMRICMTQSDPMRLFPGEWHLPYIRTERDSNNTLMYYADSQNTVYNLADAIKVSVSSCAQVSYRKLDDSLEKANKIYDMLNIGSDTKPSHVSPLEQQGTPMTGLFVDGEKNYVNLLDDPGTWQDGVTHMRKDYSLWSGNFRGWIQNRQLMINEAKW